CSRGNNPARSSSAQVPIPRILISTHSEPALFGGKPSMKIRLALGAFGFMLTGLVYLPSAVTAQPPAQKGKASGPQKGPPKGKDAEALTPNQSAPPVGFDVAKADAPRGKVETVELKAKSDGGTYKISVYTPPGYKLSEKYPVLYLLHGRSGDENTWTKDIRAA